MIPVGYMAKRVRKPSDLHRDHVGDIYSVSGCVNNEDFADYVNYWKHNGYWLFDSPEVIRNIARENSIELEGTSLFYYESHETEFDGENWHSWKPELSFPTNVALPPKKQLEGFDVVNFTGRTKPECSGLSCSYLAKELHTNAHCLFDSFEEAYTNVNDGVLTTLNPARTGYLPCIRYHGPNLQMRYECYLQVVRTNE